VAFAADRLLLATDGTPAARDLWEQKWQTADIDNAQMAARLLNYVRLILARTKRPQPVHAK